MSLQLQVNGKTVNSNSDADTPLLWVLRDELGMTGPNLVAAQACAAHVLCMSTAKPFVLAKPKSALLLAQKSALSKALALLAATPCKKHGSNTKFPSAATANLASS